MWLNLSEIEILILKLICGGSLSPGQLAEKLGKKNSFISRNLAKLEEKGLIVREGRLVKLSVASHAQCFKKLYDSRPNAKIEDWLSGNAMGILIALTGANDGIDFKLLEEDAGCSRPTLFKTLKQLYAAGITSKTKQAIRISDSFAGEFAESYANALERIILSECKGHNVAIRVRKHVVLRTDARQVPVFFSQTGLNALEKAGLEASRTSYDDYYFNLDRVKRIPELEEAFVHALLLTTLQQHQDRPILVIFLMKNARKINIARLMAFARKYWVEGAAVQAAQELDLLRNVAEHYEKGKGGLT